jgi:predicted PurR-regulated permease PerM
MKRALPDETPSRSAAESLSLGQFTGRLLVALAIAGLGLALWRLSDILALLFGAVLLAIGLCAATRLAAHYTGASRNLALAGVIALGLCAFAAALWVFGSIVAAQLGEVIRVTPDGFKLLMAWITDQPYGRNLVDQLRGANVVGATGWATSMVTGAARMIARASAYAAIGLFVAVYLAAQPQRYVHLCMRVVPPLHRATGAHFFAAAERVLRRWLVGQFVVMSTIGVLSGIGLWLIGIEAALGLGLMGGLLCFIPYVGAIMAAIPATLVALTQGPINAVWVVGMYAAVHFIEGNFITPLVQAEATSLPPVLAILSTAAFGVMLGPLGVLLAAPLTLLLLTAIEVLYVQQGLGEAPDEEALAIGLPAATYEKAPR